MSLIRSLVSLAIVLAVWLAVWLAPHLAFAAKPYGVVTVDLRPEVGEVPTHLCVVSQGQGPRTRQQLSELIAKPTGDDANELILDPSVWGGTGQDEVCVAGGACSPRVALPLAGQAADDLWVACTSDSLVADRSTRDPRVLVMMLEHLEGSPPLLESLKLAGGVVTVGVQADLSRIVVTARSLGGHYDAHTRAFRAEEGSDDSELVVLPLAPRCHGVDVELPGVRLRESDRDRLVLRAQSIDLDPHTCVGPLRGTSHMRVELPRAEGFGRLEVELPPTPDETPTATRFAASWDTAWPKGELRLAPHQLAFIWAPPACIWPTGTCPVATLEGGLDCEATPLDDGTCQYLCPAGGGKGSEGEGEEGGEDEWVDVSPPVAITFHKTNPDQRWTEMLQRPGQTLSGYVEGDQIYLGANLQDWQRNVPGSRISHVELLDDDGSTRKYAVARVDRLQIQAPHASCDPLRYRLVGDRRYVEGSAPVSRGQVEFGEVHRTQRVMTFNFTLTQGGAVAVVGGRAPDEITNPVHVIVGGQLAVNFRPRDPRLARVAYELRIAGTVGQWGYFGVGSIGDDPRRVTEKIAWSRLLVEPGVVIDVVPPLAVGIGFGVGMSWPIVNTQIPNTDRFSPILSPSLDLRFALRRWVSLILAGRMLLREQARVAVDVDDGAPVYVDYGTVSLVGVYGIQFSF